MTKLLKAIMTALALAALPTLASAQDILRVTNGDLTIELTKDDIAKLDQTTFETTTIWTEGKIEFSGPSLLSILALAGITEGVLSLTAVNDYIIEISVADITDEAPIIANLMNGEPFSRREKGPYWVVYPYDSDVKFQNEETYAQSIWQLLSIEKNEEES